MSAKIFKTHGLSKTSQLLCKLQAISTAKPFLSVSVSKLHIRSVENKANKCSIKQLLFQKHTQNFPNEAYGRQTALRKFCNNIDKPNSWDHSNVAKKEELFFSKQVQVHLMRLTGNDYDRIFRVEKLGQSISPPKYQFLTDDELRQAELKAEQTAKTLLQMPPVMNERETDTTILDSDVALSGYDSAKLVFTDITYGIHDRERIIVVRDADGDLRHANGDERDRLNQIYFPHKGRKAYVPALFEKENVEEIMRPDKYVYILDRNCEQFEPDNPLYIATAKSVYEHINLNTAYDTLWSTRHFGPMVFHLVWEKKCDDLIAWYLTRRKDNTLSDVLDVVMVYSYLHGDSKFAKNIQSSTALIEDVDIADWKISQAHQLKLIRAYIEFASTKSLKIKSALESYLEISEGKKKKKQMKNAN